MTQKQSSVTFAQKTGDYPSQFQNASNVAHGFARGECAVRNLHELTAPAGRKASKLESQSTKLNA